MKGCCLLVRLDWLNTCNHNTSSIDHGRRDIDSRHTLVKAKLVGVEEIIVLWMRRFDLVDNKMLVSAQSNRDYSTC